MNDKNEPALKALVPERDAPPAQLSVFLVENEKLPADGPAPRLYLLQCALREAGLPASAAARTAAGTCGKPFLPDCPGFHFNLSHSGAYTAIAFSEAEVGLDLQEDRPPSRGAASVLRIARRYFTQEEYGLLLEASGAGGRLPREAARRHGSMPEKLPKPPEEVLRRAAGEAPAPLLGLFYRLWTVKEAYLKYVGCGLRGGMDSFLPEPLPVVSCPLQFPPGNLPWGEDRVPSGQAPCRVPGIHSQEAEAGASQGEPAGPVSGRIRILKETELLTPARYALLPAPRGYTMTVCAHKLPAVIPVRLV